MERILVLYRIINEYPSDDIPNAFYLTVRRDKQVYLINILNVWASIEMLSTNYTFEAVVGANDRTVSLKSPASVVPVIDGVISLLLSPSGDSPQIFSRNPIAQQSYQKQTTNIGQGYHEKPQSSKVFQKNIDEKPLKKSMNRDQSRVPEQMSHASQDSTVSVISDTAVDAAIVAKEVAGAAARSLMSFATKSLKTVVTAAATLTGNIQVGKHRVMVLKELAEGGFGKVFLVKDTDSKREYAMKQLLCQSKDQLKEAENELMALKRFRNKTNLINLIDYGATSSRQAHIQKEVFFLFPFFTKGTVWNAIELALPSEDLDWPFPEARAVKVMKEICKGLVHIHEVGLAHRDMKPHNVIFDDDYSAVIMDLGSVTTAHVTVNTRQQALDLEEEAASKTSAPYRAPELTQVEIGGCVDERVDIWGLGCTMYCIAFGRSPFETTREGVLKLAILNGRFTIPAGGRIRNCVFSSGYISLIESMLLVDPTKRPGLQEIYDRLERLL